MHVVDPDDPKKKPKLFADINEQVADASKASAKGFAGALAPLGSVVGTDIDTPMLVKRMKKAREEERRKKAGKGEL
jgi:hypothetical protein